MARPGASPSRLPRPPAATGQGKTSRANTAAALVACLDAPNTIHQTIGVIDGKTNVSDALSKF